MNGPRAIRALRVPGMWAAGILLGASAVACAGTPAQSGARGAAGTAADSTVAFYETLLARAAAARWDTLAIGTRIGRFAMALEGLPYLDGTLEGPGEEVCRITGRGFDCVTFMETCLALARIAGVPGAPPPDFTDLAAAVTHTRYRNGRVAGYTSRLHYTSDWIMENARRGVFEDVTARLGGRAQSPGVGYMSAHPDRYAALDGHPDRVEAMRSIEARLNQEELHVVPKAEVAAIEGRLETGDLIAIATSIAGLDYSHTGLIYRDERGAARFLHASSAKRRVVLDGPLHEYLAGGPASQVGITVLRPMEPAGR